MNPGRILALPILIGLALAWASCVVDSTSPLSFPTRPTATESPLSSPLPRPTTDQGGTVELAPPGGTSATDPTKTATARAIDDLARRLDVAPAQIRVMRSYRDEFPAYGLGCPNAKAQPTEIARGSGALVTGQVILIAFGSSEYEYHARAGQIAFCGPRLPEKLSFPTP